MRGQTFHGLAKSIHHEPRFNVEQQQACGFVPDGAVTFVRSDNPKLLRGQAMLLHSFARIPGHLTFGPVEQETDFHARVRMLRPLLGLQRTTKGANSASRYGTAGIMGHDRAIFVRPMKRVVGCLRERCMEWHQSDPAGLAGEQVSFEYITMRRGDILG